MTSPETNKSLKAWVSYSSGSSTIGEIKEITSLEDLLTLYDSEGHPLIFRRGKKDWEFLPQEARNADIDIEVYDDYRE
jgi:hypothetical protein